MCELHNTENKQMLNFSSNTVNQLSVYITQLSLVKNEHLYAANKKSKTI